MAEGLLLGWLLAMAGYTVGIAVHLTKAEEYRRYLPRARHPNIVRGWIFDERNRAGAKAVLMGWGFARLGLVAQRVPGAAENPIVVQFDLLTLALYWGLLLLFTHWTWRVRLARQVQCRNAAQRETEEQDATLDGT